MGRLEKFGELALDDDACPKVQFQRERKERNRPFAGFSFQ
jgi:hypothetical protein